MRVGGGERDWTRAATVLLWVAILLVHLGLLDHHSLRNKEFITLRVIEQGYTELVSERLSRSHLPGYFAALKAWTQVAGTSDVALRPG